MTFLLVLSLTCSSIGVLITALLTTILLPILTLYPPILTSSFLGVFTVSVITFLCLVIGYGRMRESIIWIRVKQSILVVDWEDGLVDAGSRLV